MLNACPLFLFLDCLLKRPPLPDCNALARLPPLQDCKTLAGLPPLLDCNTLVRLLPFLDCYTLARLPSLLDCYILARLPPFLDCYTLAILPPFLDWYLLARSPPLLLDCGLYLCIIPKLPAPFAGLLNAALVGLPPPSPKGRASSVSYIYILYIYSTVHTVIQFYIFRRKLWIRILGA